MKFSRLIITLFVVFTVALSCTPFLEQISYEYHDAIFKHSVAAFAIAKALNGIISVLQGTEVELSFIVGVTSTIGQFLDPLNDMVERFSWIMLFSSIALGVEKILIEFSGFYLLKILFAFVGVLFLFSLWSEKLHAIKEWMGKIFFILVLIRFIMPVTEYTNTLIFKHYSKPIYESAKSSLVQTKNELESIDMKNVPKELSFFEKLQQKFEVSSEDMINLMIVFIFQTILFPLFLLWICYKGVGAILTKKLFASSYEN